MILNATHELAKGKMQYEQRILALSRNCEGKKTTTTSIHIYRQIPGDGHKLWSQKNYSAL